MARLNFGYRTRMFLEKKMKSSKSQLSKRALVIGPFSSPHFQVFISAISDFGLRIKFIPSDSPSRKDIDHVRNSVGSRFISAPLIHKIISKVPYSYRILDKVYGMKWRSVIIGLYIKTFNPQIIHINELQRAGYSLAHVKNIKKNKKSRLIIASSWGSDLVLFSQIDTHKIDLQNILAITDLLTAEREVELDYARDLGFSGNFISPIYNTIGLSHTYKNPSLCSTRRIILIKGYQNFAGRALNSLNAIERCSDILEGYKILVYSSSADTKIEVELLRKRSGLDVWTLENASKQDFLNYFALARLYIGLSISDGLSTSMVEAMSAGALPIQSKNSAAFDFLENGVNGFIVDPWDLENLESCIRRVISDDQLVNQAQILNRDVINNQYNYQDNLLKLRAIYESVL